MAGRILSFLYLFLRGKTATKNGLGSEAGRQFRLSGIPVQKVSKMGKKTGGGSGRAKPFMSPIGDDRLRLHALRARHPRGEGKSGYEAQKIPPKAGRVNCRGDASL